MTSREAQPTRAQTFGIVDQASEQNSEMADPAPKLRIVRELLVMTFTDVEATVE